MKPVLLVIAGPNGAGKTTVTARLRAERWSEGVEYLNPDEIARDRFGDWNSPTAVLQAAEWTANRREELLGSHFLNGSAEAAGSPPRMSRRARIASRQQRRINRPDTNRKSVGSDTSEACHPRI